jgi:hypothetical protein
VRGAGFGTLALASIALGGALGGLVLAVYLPERFGPEERATGVGVSYGPGNAVVGGFAPLVAGALAAGGRAPAVGVAAAACALAALVAVRWAARADDAAPVSPRTYRGELSARRP